jgi:hypothetical protein
MELVSTLMPAWPALEMPAWPALLMPAAGAGLGKLAEGVTRIGPPKGPLTGAGLVGYVYWLCPKTEVEIKSAAVNKILRGMVHPWVIDHPLKYWITER